MDDRRGTYIECRQSKVGKAAFPVFMAIFGLAMFTGLLPVHPIVWVFWAFLTPYSLVYSPDFTVRDDGLVVYFPWRTALVPWDKIRRVRKTPASARIYAHNLTFFNILFSFGDPFIVAAAPGRRNYEEAFAVIKKHTGGRFRDMRY